MIKKLWKEFKKVTASKIKHIDNITGDTEWGIITEGFEKYYAPGRAPFRISVVVLTPNNAHILISGRCWEKSKWQHRLSNKFRRNTLHFYNNDDQQQLIEFNGVKRNIIALQREW